jgi:hypothetical protein
MRRAESLGSPVATRRLQLQAGQEWFAMLFLRVCGVPSYGVLS